MRSNNRLVSIGQRCKEELNNNTATHAQASQLPYPV